MAVNEDIKWILIFFCAKSRGHDSQDKCNFAETIMKRAICELFNMREVEINGDGKDLEIILMTHSTMLFQAVVMSFFFNDTNHKYCYDK